MYISSYILKKCSCAVFELKACLLTIVNKYKALKEIDAGQICIATAKKYGVAKNTVSHCEKKRADLFEAVEGNNASKKRKRMETATYEEFDSAVYKWLKTARYSNIPISCSIFKEKALEFAKLLELNDFHASDGWVSR